MHSSAVPARERLRFEFSRLQTGRQFAAVVDYLFDIRPRRVQPVVAELVIVDDSLLFARVEGDERGGYFVGRREQLERELAGFASHLGLATDLRHYVLGRIDALARR
ncbi:MAG: hypothetical protein GIX03_11470 [Candidatus Eremiobacteraeota bacterium]|nr:hypothetical protein [Candidatus Eremiobacteraeota bacterium]MBC5803588.1 hypothetical protein [Candidatus Eremiobacteraeota bacterium]MBC5822667.1 hypothetical protein [Candidatus Eremiobacteraeota bacterium]